MAARLIVLAIFFTTHCCMPLYVTAQQKSSSTTIFKEVAQQVGLRFQHYNGMTGKVNVPEITGSGAALFDYDNDGDLDLFLLQGNFLEPNTETAKTLFPWRGSESPRGRLFRNDLKVETDGRRTLSFTDVTQRS